MGGITAPEPLSKSAGVGARSVSLNFWFDISTDVLAPPHPLPLHLELELARHAELLLADACGSAALGPIAEALMGDVVEDTCAIGSDVDVVSLPVRNLLLHRLARILGPDNVGSFVCEYLDP